MELTERVRVLAALAEEHRLRIVDELLLSDRTPAELREDLGIPSNLLAHHLAALEEAGLVERRRSDGDGRRRYLTLRRHLLSGLLPERRLPGRRLLFVCTHNSARSQFAAALWSQRSGRPAESAGTDPAPRVHPEAVAVARRHGLDLSAARPRRYQEVQYRPDLVVSVCDRAREAALPFAAPQLHWSVPDPVADGRRRAFEEAFGEIAQRVTELARVVES